MTHSPGDSEWNVRLCVYEEHHSRHPAPPVERRRQVDSLDITGIGGHLLDELDGFPGTYPGDLEINPESTADESTAQPDRYSGSLITPIAPPPTRSVTPEPPTTARAYTAYRTGYNTTIPIRMHSTPLEDGHAQVFRRVRGRRPGNAAERGSNATTYPDTALGSTFSRQSSSYQPSRTTLSQEDADNYADVEDNSDRAPTAYQPSHTTPSHHSIGTREDVDTEAYDYCPDQGPQSELPYSSVWVYNADHVRNAVEDYERHHGQRH